MVNLTYISVTNYNKELFDFIKSDNFIGKMSDMTQKERYKFLESNGVTIKGVYIIDILFNSLTDCVDYIKKNEHVFERDNTVYYIHSKGIRQLNKPVMKHHTKKIKVIHYDKWLNKNGGG